MYHKEQQQQSQRTRSRCKEKPRRTSLESARKPDLDPLGWDLASTELARGEGNVPFRKRIFATKVAMDSSCGSGLPVEENSFALEFRRSSSKKASGAPIKTLTGEEMSKEVEIKLPSPGVVARLMGLDTMPPLVVPKQWKETGNLRKTSTVGSQERYVTSDDRSLRMSTSEHQKFKDVFEVVETSKVEKYKNQTVRKGMSSSKQGETDMAFIKQFIDAKCLSTDETLQNSKECYDAQGVLDYNKDLFLKFLQEPNSLFTKHVHDLKCASPSRHASHITILKSSKGSKHETGEVCFTSGRHPERCTRMQRDVISSYRKPATSYACQSLKEHSYLPDKLTKSRYAGKTEVYHHPTKIVVLNPSLEKAQNIARTVPLARSHEDSKVGCKRHAEVWRSGIRELYSEGNDRHKLSDNKEVMGHKTKNSREIGREFAEQVRHTASSSTEKVLASKFNGYRMDESSCIRSAMGGMKKSEAFHWSRDRFDECGNSFGASSSVNREARKRLTERWKLTHRFQEVGVVGRGSSTLGEMLSLSDKETPKLPIDRLITQEVPKKEVARDEALATQVYPFGIRSKDNWKNRCSTDLPTSMSLSASSSIYDNPKPSSRNRFGGSDNCYMLNDVLDMGSNDSLDGKFNRQRSFSLRSFKYHSNKARFYSSGDEDKLPEREIHVNSEELRNRIRVGYLAEEERMIPELSDDATSDRRHMVEKFSVPENNDVKFSAIPYEELVKQSMTLTVLKDGACPGYNQKDVVIKETSIKHPQVDSLPSHCDISESGSPVSLDKADRPSPVSVLEPPSEEERASSGCFKKISSDLQDLRMQLRLLKLESADKYDEELVLISSDEETWGECHSEILQAFRDDEDRDFSYLLDIIIESGVNGSDWNMLFDACYSRECPVGADVFDKLEKKYSLLVSWSRTERKLLFDLINATLVDAIAPHMDLHPWVMPKRRLGPAWAREGFVEEVWQMVVRQRKEPSGNLEEKPLEMRWLDLGNDIAMIGAVIERMLKEDLLEELVSELILK